MTEECNCEIFVDEDNEVVFSTMCKKHRNMRYHKGYFEESE